MCVLQLVLVVASFLVHPLPGGWYSATLLVVATLAAAIIAPALPSTPLSHLLDDALRSRPAAYRLLIGTLLLMGGVYMILRGGAVWWDEAVSYEIAQYIGQHGHGSFFRNYTSFPWLGGQHPPLASMLYGEAVRTLGFSLVGLRLISLCFAIGVVVLTYEMGVRLYGFEVGMVAGLVAIGFPVTLLMGTVAHNDIQQTFFCLAALYLVTTLTSRATRVRAAVAGGALAAGILTKYLAVFFVPVILAYALLLPSARIVWRHLLLAGVVTAVLVLGWLAIAAELGIFAAQRSTAVVYSEGFMVGRSDFSTRFFRQNVLLNLPRYVGLYWLPVVALGSWIVIRTRSLADAFVLLWPLIFSVPLLLTLPDARYFLPMFPALALIAARGILSLPSNRAAVLGLGLAYCGVSLALLALGMRNMAFA